MAKAMSSPTAQILRGSRLFCMPPPLPQPSIDIALNGLVRTSDSATLPYPTRQAITAPASSRHRGDWGLKRPLPDKTNRTNSPYVRISALDNLEHITDFDSAADHTRTLQKWQEMHIPMIQPAVASNSSKTGHISAFDDRYDGIAMSDPRKTPRDELDYRPLDKMRVTADRAEQIRSVARAPGGEVRQRWKRKGPWLPHMSQNNFDTFLRTRVNNAKTREEFREFLRRVRLEQRRSAAENTLKQDRGYDPGNPDDKAEVERRMQVDDENEDLDRWIIQLRDNNGFSASELGILVQQFFDLPDLPKNIDVDGYDDKFVQELSRQALGPPSTHRSGGLSYVRPRMFMDNDPAYGPQLEKSPVQARVLEPRETSRGSSGRALIGVGGVVTEDRNATSYKGAKESNIALAHAYNFDREGGTKIWVDADHASMDEAGRIQLTTFDADTESKAIRTGAEDPRKTAAGKEETDSEMRSRLKNAEVSDELGGLAGSSSGGPAYKKREEVKPFGRESMERFKDGLRERRRNGVGDSMLDLLNAGNRRS